MGGRLPGNAIACRDLSMLARNSGEGNSTSRKVISALQTQLSRDPDLRLGDGEAGALVQDRGAERQRLARGHEGRAASPP